MNGLIKEFGSSSEVLSFVREHDGVKLTDLNEFGVEYYVLSGDEFIIYSKEINVGYLYNNYSLFRKIHTNSIPEDINFIHKYLYKFKSPKEFKASCINELSQVLGTSVQYNLTEEKLLEFSNLLSKKLHSFKEGNLYTNLVFFVGELIILKKKAHWEILLTVMFYSAHLPEIITPNNLIYSPKWIVDEILNRQISFIDMFEIGLNSAY
ncbi:hypothetical protein [Spirosoma foliorum]|uniref:Uncharacterized protein n=1 Tax=Spirosoma foliorum TaxID=2710596 RepID=A0A7G5GSQ9_9BACT|nr:hypothetical protein [Spirosoma foliorum]QMW01901.1 hypothetical protein H3H32_28790 [Spirosoma foliorum]